MKRLKQLEQDCFKQFSETLTACSSLKHEDCSKQRKQTDTNTFQAKQVISLQTGMLLTSFDYKVLLFEIASLVDYQIIYFRFDVTPDAF